MRRSSAIAWTLVVLAVFWMPNDGDPAPEHFDKVVHAGAFASLVVVWAWASGVRSGRALAVVAAWVVLLAIVSEVVQPFLPWPRTFDVYDVGLDVVGIAAGSLAWMVRMAQTQKRRSLEVG